MSFYDQMEDALKAALEDALQTLQGRIAQDVATLSLMPILSQEEQVTLKRDSTDDLEQEQDHLRLDRRNRCNEMNKQVLRRLMCNKISQEPTLKIGSNDDIFLRLAKILADDSYDFETLDTLTDQLCVCANDIQIWRTVLVFLSKDVASTNDLTASSLQSTLPRTPVKGRSGLEKFTPYRRASSAVTGSDQTHAQLLPYIKEEMTCNTIEEVQGMRKKYFSVPLPPEIQSSLDGWVREPHDRYPTRHSETQIWQFLSSFTKKFAGSAPRALCTTKSPAEVTNAQGRRQLDLLVKDQRLRDDETTDMRDIAVVGELTASQGEKWPKFQQLTVYMRDVFAVQPLRLFIQGFLLIGAKLYLLTFDRSGALISKSIRVSSEGTELVECVVKYLYMSDDRLGYNHFISGSGNEKKIQLTLEDETSDLDSDLSDGPKVREFIFDQQNPDFVNSAIVSRATSCYTIADSAGILKFSWADERKNSEADRLRFLAKKGVMGIPRLLASRELVDVAQLRAGLAYRDQQSRSFLKHVKAGTTPFRDRKLVCLAMQPVGETLTRCRDASHLLTVFRDVIQQHHDAVRNNVLHRDISDLNVLVTDPKQNHGNSGMLIDWHLATSIDPISKRPERTGAAAMTGTYKFMAIEVLESIVGDTEDDFEHTFRHDLEAFFYVLLCLCMSESEGVAQEDDEGESDPTSTKKAQADPLAFWHDRPVDEIIACKRGQMTSRCFKTQILSRFTGAFQPLRPFAETFRKILFGNGKILFCNENRDSPDLYVGTPQDSRAVYRSIFAAIKTASDSLL